MPAIGVLFSIDELGGGFYGYEAYRIVFASLGPRILASATLRDGDTALTLQGKSRQYCIAVESHEPGAIEAIRRRLMQSTAKGLLPPGKRFLDEARIRTEPLMKSAEIDRFGQIVSCDADWIVQAYHEAERRGEGRETAEAARATPPSARPSDAAPAGPRPQAGDEAALGPMLVGLGPAALRKTNAAGRGRSPLRTAVLALLRIILIGWGLVVALYFVHSGSVAMADSGNPAFLIAGIAVGALSFWFAYRQIRQAPSGKTTRK